MTTAPALLAATLAPSDAEPSEIRRVAEEVLARPAFDEAAVPLWNRVLQWALDGIARVLAALAAGGGGAVIGWAILALAVAATALIGLRLLRRVRRDRGSRARGDVTVDGRSAAQWREQARALEADGDHAGALRCRYRALLAELATAGVVDRVAGHTARDHLREVTATAPGASPSMRWATEAFEATWYDRRPVTADDVERMRRASEAVRQATVG